MPYKALLLFVALFPGFAVDASAQWANPHPQEARISYPRGAAPFHVRVRHYAMQLRRIFDRGYVSALPRELGALVVDENTLAALSALLSTQREREDEARASFWERECIPMLRGDTVTEERARAAFERMDAVAWRDAVAEEVMNDIATRFGAALADRLRARIITEGEPIEFTLTAHAKEIEFGRGGLFVSHMMIVCGTHPDHPRPF